MVRSPNNDTDFHDIVTAVLKRVKLAPYLSLTCQNYTLQNLIDLMKENGSTLKNTRNRRYSKEIIMDPDYAVDLALLTNKPVSAEFCSIVWDG